MIESNRAEIAKLRQYDPEASQQLADLLFGDNLTKRDKWAQFIRDNKDLMVDQKEFVGLYREREIAYQRIAAVAKAKLFSIYDFKNDPINLFTCHEQLSLIDGSLATKFTVQNNLFGGSLIGLSTE